jgi:hypothetical protein
MHALR